MMRILTLMVATVVGIVGFAFHMRNNSPVTIDLFSTEVSVPLSWVIVASLTIGVFLGIITMLWSLAKIKHENLKVRRTLKKSLS